MKLSTDRILTTHVGSLPRPQALVDLMVKRDHGEHYDAAEMRRSVRQAVADLVARQVKIGVDIVSDGEASKIGYATYMKERLTGFRDENYVIPPQRDLAEFPELRERMVRFIGGKPLFRRFCCTGDIEVRDHEAVREDIANFKAAVAASKPTDAFLTAASPGVVTVFHPNHHYKTHAAYAEAVGAAMREEYEAIAGAGLVLQLDCPDLAMAGHTASRIERGGVPEARGTPGGGAQPRGGEHSGLLDAAAFVLGQLRGAARFRHSVAEDSSDRAEGEAAGDFVRGFQSAARARMGGLARGEAARG